MIKKPNEIQELKNRIRLEKVGLWLTRRAADNATGEELRKFFGDQAVRIKNRIKDLESSLKKKKRKK